MASKEVLEKGMIKRIGDGASTNIWEDRWIPKHFNARPLTPGVGQEVSMVSELITESGQWDADFDSEHLLPSG